MARSLALLRRPVVRLSVAATLSIVLTVAAMALGLLTASTDRLSDRYQGRAPLSDELVVVGIDEDTLEADDAYRRAAQADAERPRARTGTRGGRTPTAGGGQQLGAELQDLLRPGLSPGAQAALVTALADAGASVIVWHYPRPVQSGDEVLRTAISESDVRVLVPMDGEILRLDEGLPVLGATFLPGAYVRDMPVTHELLSADGKVDGIVRRLPLAARSTLRDEIVPSVDLAALFAHSGQVPLLTRSDDGVVVGSGPDRQEVPTEGPGLLRIRYASPLRDGGFDSGRGARGESTTSAQRAGTPFVSAREVILGEVDASDIAGHVVVVGAVTPTDAERLLVPGGPSTGIPSTLVHANAINAMLTRSFVATARPVESLVLLLVFAALAAASSTLLRARSSVPVVGALLVGVLLLGRLRWDAGTILPLAGLLLVTALAYVFGFLLRYRVETEQRRHVAGLFSQYVPESVALQLLEPGEADRHAAGERLDITVLFCDLRGFTRTAAALTPPDVRDLLNTYYRHASAVVLDRRGTLMQYTGDEVFAVFGAPLSQPDHAAQALACALELHDALEAINADLERQGLPTIQYGIGVNAGEVVAAHVGDDRRKQYSVIGDTVNVGARLCSLAGAGEIVCTREVWEAHQADGRAGATAVTADPVSGASLKGVDRELELLRIGR